ncbi:hypothetical protein [Microbacterium hominis]|nr:hypothetical protein [Microbacterium hominis]
MHDRHSDPAPGGNAFLRATTRFFGRLADICGSLARSLSGRY